MYLECQLVFKSYKPLNLEKGMFFITEMMGSSLIMQIEQVPRNQEEFISENGYPVEPYIVDISTEDDSIVATPEQIGWFDEGDVFEKATFSDKGDPYLEYPKNFYTLEDLELDKLINPERRINYGMFFTK